MLKTAYLGILFTLMVIMFMEAGEVHRRKDQVSRSIFALFLSVLVSLVSNSFYLMTSELQVAYIFYSIFGASITWLLFFFLRYVLIYTNLEEPYRKSHLHVILFVLVSFDTVDILLNPLFHHAFLMEERQVTNWGLYFERTTIELPYIIHLVFCYILVVAIVVCLLIQALRSPKMYRGRFKVILVSFLTVIVLDALEVMTQIPVDISLLFYSVASFIVYFYSVRYVSRSMQETMMQVSIQKSNLGMCFYDMFGRCIYVNDRGIHMMRRIPSFPDNGDAMSDAEIFFKRWKRENWKNEDEDMYLSYKMFYNNREYRYEFHVQSLRNEAEEKIGYMITCDDVTKETLRFEEEHFRATHDALTGLYNEQYFHEKVTEQIEKEPEESYVMITSDIRNFKLVNDIFGSERGDEILKKHAQLFKQHARPGTIYGRLGEDHFASFLKKSTFDPKLFQDSAMMIEDEYANGFFRMQIKIGVYEVLDNTEPVFVMIDKCNIAIQSIKGLFSRSLLYYDEKLFQKTMEQNNIINEFDDALEHGEFQIYLQAQTRANGDVIGAEALARWLHPEKGLISPGVFIPVLEQAGLIYRLDAYVWELAVKQLAQWREEGKMDWRISVNISAQDQYYLDIYETMTSLVEKYHVPPQMIVLEITESIFVTEVERHLLLIEKLQYYGFEIGIDDFGSGYSSLNILKDIFANELKIDMGFLQKTQNKERSEEIIASVIDMAKRLHMEIVVEGVETEEQLAFLRQYNCDAYQGFYFSRPIPVEDFEEKYNAGE